MKIDVLTLFPQMFSGPFDQSIVKRAKDKGLVNIELHDLRRWAIDERGSVDDRPYGGGVGMVLRIEPIYNAIEDIKKRKGKIRIVLLDARGNTFSQPKARSYSKLDQLILICGHYEGIDERVKKLADESISIGNYVLTGGEIPAMVITDAVTRLIPGVLEKPEAVQIESFSNQQPESSDQYLEYPQYTRPEEFNGWKVPEVLLSGNHAEIKKWREKIRPAGEK
ncbi:tRNA (guanosine(37)-N1)-methyltransferase TrmD [Patescibacteria group bacterium]|nr:tRNA (guanosine(37)-N1)-methyltransferase TrmD [Patescibacteria group bacterium]